MAFDNAPALGGHRSGCKRRFCRHDSSNMMFGSHRQEQQQQKEHRSNSAGRVHIPTEREREKERERERERESQVSKLSYVLISFLNCYIYSTVIEIYQSLCIDQKHHFNVCRFARHARRQSYDNEEARK